MAVTDSVLPRDVQTGRIVLDLFDAAILRGERAMTQARLAVLAVIFIEHLLIYSAEQWFSFYARLWMGMGFVLVGVAGSLLTLWLLRGRTRPGALPILSVTLDALLVLGIGLPAAIWPRDPYPGILHFPTYAFAMLAIIGAGLRMESRSLLTAVGLNLAGAALLLEIDLYHQEQVIPNLLPDWLMWTGAFLGAGLIGAAIGARIRRMAFDVARAVLDAERARQTLGVYVSEEVAAVALASGALQTGGRRQNACVLFSDLRGFTTYASRLPPEQLVAELNEYLVDMVAVIRAEGGVVDKYIGDAIMAVYGVPQANPDCALQAIRTADAMERALVLHNQRRVSRGLPPLKHGIGVHYGEVIVGNIGTPERMQYTVVGDTVNLASRLESATKDMGATVIVSGPAVEAARSVGALPPLTPRGALSVRGRADPVDVYTLS